MARYTGPVCRLCRREGLKLYLKENAVIRINVPLIAEVMHLGSMVNIAAVNHRNMVCSCGKNKRHAVFMVFWNGNFAIIL